MTGNKSFVHLHTHTEYSWLDGLSKVQEYVDRAAQLKMPALAVTDHGNIAASHEQYAACHKAELEAVLGFEGYWAPNLDAEDKKAKAERDHITILAKGEPGWRVLTELNAATWKNFYYKPLISRELLESLGKDAKHLVVLSGCSSGPIAQAYMNQGPKRAKRELAWWKSIFPHFFIELQDHACCVPGTMIQTPGGDKEISSLNPGDLVWGYDHNLRQVVSTKVMNTMCNSGKGEQLYGNDRLQTTGNHPWWEEKELRYVPVRDLWQNSNQNYSAPQSAQRMSLAAVRTVRRDCENTQCEILFLSLCQISRCRDCSGQNYQKSDKTSRGASENAGRPLETCSICQETFRIPHRIICFSGDSCKITGITGCHQTRCAQPQLWTGEEQKRVSATIGCLEIAPLTLEVRSPLRRSRREWRRSQMLLVGSQPLGPEDRYRDRWPLSHSFSTEERTRQTKDTLAGITRLGGGEIHKCDGRCRCKFGSEADKVYNLKTETGNYFAENTLVHNCDRDRKLNDGLIELAQASNTPLVITNDPHYCDEEQAEFHDVLLAIQTGADLDAENRLRFDGEGHYLKSAKEMRQAFAAYPNAVVGAAMANSLRIAKACRAHIPEWESRTWHIPRYPDTPAPYATIVEICTAELKRRKLVKPQYIDRCKAELKIIKHSGISDFLLITMDVIRWAHTQEIPVGPGRGSVCGSLVCMLLGIHQVDPLRYDLPFERFLNPERIRMPDIDSDFGQERRHEIFDYVYAKYGEDNVLNVATLQKSKTKKTLKFLAKAHGIGFAEANNITKNLDDDTDLVEQIPADFQRRYPHIIDQLEHIVGIKCGVSAHPAGVVIADPAYEIKKRVPQMWIASSKRWVAQFDLEVFEEIGLLKSDFLGLRTLDTIKVCLDFVETKEGKRPVPAKWIPDRMPWDAGTYAMLNSGDTGGVFQMEGPVNTRGIQEIGCDNFELIVSCTALYRTGPILAKFPEMFIQNKENPAKARAQLDPRLAKILEKTHYVMIYQEQITQICRELAGFSISQVDDMRENIKHKRHEEMQSMEAEFVKGCIDHGMEPVRAEKLWSQIVGFSLYGYNRNHAVAYSLTTYTTAVLKYRWPLEFYAALLATVEDKEKRRTYMRDCYRRGFKLLAPDINKSGAHATPDYEQNGIRFGFMDVAGIGEKAAPKLVAERGAGYESVEQVAAAAHNKKIVDALGAVGALAPLGLQGNPKRYEELLGWSLDDDMVLVRRQYGKRHNPPQMIYGRLVQSTARKTRFGKPFRLFQLRWSPAEEFQVYVWSEAEEIFDTKRGSLLRIRGSWQEERQCYSVSFPDQVKVIDEQGS